MNFEWIALQDIQVPNFNLALPGYIVLGAYLALTVVLVIRHVQRMKRFDLKHWGLLVTLTLAAPVCAGLLQVQVDNPLSVLDGMTFSLLGLLPVVVASLWLGIIPAILVGFVTGLTWMLIVSGRLTHPLEIALWGAVLAALLRQRYRGRIADWLRQPLITTLITVWTIGWPLTLVGLFVTDSASIITSLDRTLTAFLPVLVELTVMVVVAGGVVQITIWQWNAIRPKSMDVTVTPPWERQLSQRLLFAFVPIAAIVIAILVGVVAMTSYQVSTRLVIEQMARDAANAGSGIPFYVQLGRSLIRDLAADPDLLAETDAELQDQLADGLRAVPFFQQLVYVDADESVLAAYPEIISTDPDLFSEEMTRLSIALTEGAPAEVTYHHEGEVPEVAMTFLAPIINDSGQPVGVLLGRTILDDNIILEPVVDVLREGFIGSGEGFIVDGQNLVILYPSHPELQNQMFSLEGARQLRVTRDGLAFRQRLDDGGRRLIYILPVVGRSDWSVVVFVPNEVAIAKAVEIALPTLIVLITLALIALPLALTVVRYVTTPLEDLLKAVELITEGQLDRPLHVNGNDEIGRLGLSFEQMRISLKKRLSEQERLLRVTRSVSSSLELFRAMPPILSSALDVTNAAGVRIVLRRSRQDGNLQTYAAGEAAAAMAPLDEQLITLVERQGTIVISQIERASPTLDISLLPPQLRSLVAFPLRSDTSFFGVLWMCYDHEHALDQSEMTFLSTLAGQTAVGVANAYLYADAQEGRNQLEAVLESTADAMVVVDNQGQIMLMNPSAERFFKVRGEQARGRRAEDVLDIVPLSNVLTNLQEPVSILELPDQSGKTLLASTSTIVSKDGAIIGRVAVLRDISTLKELDNLKTVFLRMVSHDLRSPLTYMKGYLSLLPLAGDMNDKQMDSLGKINNGIEQISEMTERLLYLSRLQFGDVADLELALVDVQTMLDEIYQQLEPVILDKEADVVIEVAEKLPLVLADGMLYRQAVFNLINNALKYSSEGSRVVVKAYQEADRRVTVVVQDKGIGIRREHQTRLFEAFYRVPHIDGDPKRPRGTGIGLALVRAIANAHGGDVGFTSEFQRGSTFYISLPLREPTEAEI